MSPINEFFWNKIVKNIWTTDSDLTVIPQDPVWFSCSDDLNVGFLHLPVTKETSCQQEWLTAERRRKRKREFMILETASVSARCGGVRGGVTCDWISFCSIIHIWSFQSPDCCCWDKISVETRPGPERRPEPPQTISRFFCPLRLYFQQKQ